MHGAHDGAIVALDGERVAAKGVERVRQMTAQSDCPHAKGERGEITLKVQDVPRGQLLEILKPFIVELLDVREN